MATLHALLRPYRPSASEGFDAVMAAHLLNRAGFGGTPDEIEKVRKLGPIDAVEWLMDFPDAPAEEQSTTDLPDHSAVEEYPRTYRELALKMRNMSPEERMEYRQMVQRANRPAVAEA